MAQFGVQATQLSAADTKAAKFVRQPVADQSSNVLLGSALDMTDQAYEGYQMASIEDEQEKVIDEYMSRRSGTTQRLGEEIGALDVAEKSIWEKVSSDPNYQPDVTDFNAVDQALQSRLSKLKLAQEQGVMSPQAFTDRVLAVTREAINRNPGMYEQLKQHSSRVLEMSGIVDTVKADAKTAEDAKKSQDKMLENIVTLAGKHDVPTYMTPSGGIDYSRMKGEVDKIQQQKQIVTAAENFGKLDTEEKKKVGRDFMAGGNGIGLMNGKLTELLSSNAMLLNQGGDVQGTLTQMRLRGEAAYQQYFQMLSPIVADSPAAKEALDYFRKQIDVSMAFMEKATTKEDAAKRSTAITQMLRNEQFQEVSKMVNPELLQMTTQILNTIGAPRILEQNSELMGQMVNTFGDLLNGVSGSPRVNYDASLQGKNVVSQGLITMAKEGLTDPKALQFFEKTFSTIANDLQNPDVFKTTGQKFGFYEKLIRDLGDPTLKGALSKVGTGSISQATGMIDDYVQLTTKDMWKQVRSWEGKGVEITLDVLPDGRSIFKTNNPQATQDLNGRYAPRLNDSLAAMSNLMGLDMKSTAVNQFYPNYLPQFADDPDLTPLDIKTVQQANAALKAGKINKQEWRVMVDEFK
jgi:hypothetical protein